MRAPVVLLLLALGGTLGGGALIGTWCLGLCLIADSVAVAAFALWRDWPEHKPGVHAVPGQGLTLAEVLERSRSA